MNVRLSHSLASHYDFLRDTTALKPRLRWESWRSLMPPNQPPDWIWGILRVIWTLFCPGTWPECNEAFEGHTEGQTGADISPKHWLSRAAARRSLIIWKLIGLRRVFGRT